MRAFTQYLKWLFLFGLIASTTLACGNKKITGNPSYQKEIETRYHLIVDATNKRDFDRVFDLTHPKIFDLVPRSLMVSTIEDTFKDFSLHTDVYEIIDYSKPVEHEGEEYVLFHYNANMVFEVFDKEALDTEVLAGILAASYGKENITTESDKVFINAKDKTTFAIKAKDGVWYFLENDLTNPFYDQLFPKPVQKQLGIER